MNYKQKYLDHKYNANKRGIDFHFTYEEWIQWWGDDILKRGHCKGNLVMSRYGDVGPYHPDNVFKNTQEQNISDGHKGKTLSEETKAKMSAARKGRPGKPQSEETKAKKSAALKGRPRSDETKAKISEASKGRTHSEETKAKIGAARKGRPGKTRSEETKAKMSAARKAYLAKKKEITNVEN